IATATSASNLLQSYDYKETGVFLEVLPRVNASGMVNMEINQEVTDVGAPDTSVDSQRTFLKRKVSSKVMVRSGQTLVLGGLIRDNRSDAKGGFPILYKLPVVGPLFGNTEENVNRTELIVLITPQVVQNSQEAEQVTEEIKRKMREVAPLVTPAG
ncbi:MAG: type II and III secretion system protein, partial [Candidatus Contendobacter sp.]